MPAPRLLVVLTSALTVVSGAANALTYTSLGMVFSSAVTGNVALLGISTVFPNPELSRVVVALSSYALGAACAGYLLGGLDHPSSVWPARVTTLLAVELALLVVLSVVWLATDGRPGDVASYAALVLTTLSMGVQSSAFHALHVAGVLGTTYVSGDLVAWMTSLSTRRIDWAAAASLLGLVVGAVVEAVFVAHARPLAGIFPALVVATVVVVAATPRFRRRVGTATEQVRD